MKTYPTFSIIENILEDLDKVLTQNNLPKQQKEEIVGFFNQLIAITNDKLHRRNLLIKAKVERIKELEGKNSSQDRFYIVEHKLHKIALPLLYACYNEEDANELREEKAQNPYTSWITVKTVFSTNR